MISRLKPNKFLLGIFFLTLFFNVKAQNNCKEVVGYYPNWQWYDRAQLVNPQTVDYSKYTILEYCFFAPQPDGSINSTDAWADENLLLGQPDWINGGYIPNTSIVDLAHNNNVKILPSIGGWTLSGNFPSIAADPVKRATFAQACVNLIQTYNFDGIDIDWEYPGYTPHGGTSADIVNFTLLLQEIRTAIDNYGNSVGKTMLLTAAVGTAQDKMDDVDWPAVSGLLDIINLMSYDFFGAWDATTNHNAPLTAPTQGNPDFNIEKSVDLLVNAYGVSPNKITVGLAFYGRSVKTNGSATLHGPSNGNTDATTFWEDDGSPLYYNVMNKAHLFTNNWDNNAQVPYLTGNGNLNTFVSYDNERSIGLKAQFIVDNNLRGAIIWEITGDYIETSPGSGIIAGTPLVDTLNNVFCNYTGGGSTGNAPTVSINGNITICSGESTTITASGADSYSWNNGQNTASINVNPTSTTTYTVVGSNNFGTDTETITVTVNPTPSTPSINNSNGTLDAQVIGMNYQWFLNGNPISGATNQTYTPTQAGDYTVQVTSQQGCSNTSNIYTFGAAPTVSIIGNTSICLGDQLTITASGADTYNWNTGDNTASININPTTTTTYSVVGTNNFGNDTETITVIVNTPPNQPSIIQNGSQLTCNTSANAYQWYFNGNPITGTNSQNYTPNQNGNYSVEITDGNGCTANSTDFNYQNVSSSINELENQFIVYPNPTNGVVHIINKNLNIVSLNLIDISGKRIANFGQFNSEKITIDVTPFAKGIYFIQLIDEQNNIKNIKLIHTK